MSKKLDIQEVEVVIDYSAIDSETERLYKEIEEKINKLEARVKALVRRQEMLDSFIERNYAQLEATDSKNYKLRNQLQISISKQLEIQQLVIDTIIKYENLIQSYRAQQARLQNDKLSNYIKWKKSNESNADEKEFKEILRKFEEATRSVSKLSSDKDSGELKGPTDLVSKNEILNSVLKETFDEGYEI